MSKCPKVQNSAGLLWIFRFFLRLTYKTVRFFISSYYHSIIQTNGEESGRFHLPAVDGVGHGYGSPKDSQVSRICIIPNAHSSFHDRQKISFLQNIPVLRSYDCKNRDFTAKICKSKKKSVTFMHFDGRKIQKKG